MEDIHRDEPEGEDVDTEIEREVEGTDAGDRPVDRFRRSATGAVVAAGLFGLRDALEGRPEKEEVTIVNEAPATAPKTTPARAGARATPTRRGGR